MLQHENSKYFGALVIFASLLFPTLTLAQSECGNGDNSGIQQGPDYVGFLCPEDTGQGGGGNVSQPPAPPTITPPPNNPPPQQPPPDFSEDNGNWSDDGISISWGNPQDLITTGDDLSDGKAYQVPHYSVIVPRGQELTIMDSPGGFAVGAFEHGTYDLRVKYYYNARDNLWAGVCQYRQNCGWVVADYLVSLPQGEQLLGMFSVNQEVTLAYEQPYYDAYSLGELFAGDLVAVIREEFSDGTNWAMICRLADCGAWIPFTDLYYEF